MCSAIPAVLGEPLPDGRAEVEGTRNHRWRREELESSLGRLFAALQIPRTLGSHALTRVVTVTCRALSEFRA